MCGFDKEKGPGWLMKKGLILILVGHINFILGAIVHGSVLRHISKPNNEITTEFTAANIISVTSALLSIASGIIAILVSRNVPVRKLHIGLVVSSLLNALLSAACCVGLLIAISVTVSGDGAGLMKGCKNASEVPINARTPIFVECPFDTTRIYDTTMALWFPMLFLAALEVALSVWCLVIGLTLGGIGPCARIYRLQYGDEAEAFTPSRRPEGTAAQA
ncbi:keratinocyte-associated protein 3 [Alosa pseudoharengus]|uniref:keratinocyte-associated protein 3 n=1 Tax=Alosa pseudoharengus TaxID=34774 RepID=UPI003F8A92CF